MLVKGKFIEVLETRTFTTKEGKEKYSVEYVIAAPYNRRDGTQGENQFIIQVVYDQKPNLVAGPVNDEQVYEFELWFKVNTSRDSSRKWMNVLCTKASVSII